MVGDLRGPTASLISQPDERSDIRESIAGLAPHLAAFMRATPLSHQECPSTPWCDPSPLAVSLF